MKAAGRLAAMVGDKSRTRRERIEKMLCEYTGLAMQALLSRAVLEMNDINSTLAVAHKERIAKAAVEVAEAAVARLLQWGEEGGGDEADV